MDNLLYFRNLKSEKELRVAVLNNDLPILNNIRSSLESGRYTPVSLRGLISRLKDTNLKNQLNFEISNTTNGLRFVRTLLNVLSQELESLKKENANLAILIEEETHLRGILDKERKAA